MDTNEEVKVEGVFGLEEAVALVKEDKLDDPRIKQYVRDVEECAHKAFADKSYDYLASSVALVMAFSLARLAVDDDGDPDLNGMMTALALSQNSEFKKMLVCAYKMAVGLTIKEGLK